MFNSKVKNGPAVASSAYACNHRRKKDHIHTCLSKKSNKRTNALKAKQKSVSMYVSVYTTFVHLSFAYLVLFDLVLFYTIDNYPVNTCLFCNLLSRLFK